MYVSTGDEVHPDNKSAAPKHSSVGSGMSTGKRDQQIDDSHLEEWKMGKEWS